MNLLLYDMWQDQTDDVIEIQLYLRHVTPDSFRRYRLVVENAVAVRTHDVRLVRSKHVHPPSLFTGAINLYYLCLLYTSDAADE